MKETIKIRVNADLAHLIFPGDEGEFIGSLDGFPAKLVKLSPSDPRCADIALLDKTRRIKGESPFFYSWSIHREYTPAELQSARLFSLSLTSRFWPSGEQCGTVYNDKVACRMCGGGAKQQGPLILRAGTIPRKKDICWTFSGETVVSDRLVDKLIDNKITGVSFQEIKPVRPLRKPGSTWFHLVPEGGRAVIAPQTRFGINPFDDDADGTIRCSTRGIDHVAGFTELSELCVERNSWSDVDFAISDVLIGQRIQQHRPYPLMLISPRLRELLIAEKVPSLIFEIAHFV